MRRYILFVLFLCLHWVAWGQKDYEYRYWFDKDHGKQQTGTFSSGMLHIDADLSELDASLHAIHLQVKDTGGVWSAPVTRYFVHDVAPKTTFEYWLDSEMQRHQLSAPSGHVDMDVSGLEEGLHFLRFQLSDNQGQSWSPLTRCFFKIPREEDFTCSYWVDADYANAKSVKYTGEPVMLDVADMEDGFHILYMQVHSKNSASMPATRMFIKVPQTAGVSSLTCICLIDGQLYKSEQVASEGGVVKWDLDVASLSQGLHNMQVQVLTPTGAATNVSNHFFIRTALQEELDNMSLVYSVDGKVFQSVAGKASNGLYHFDVDVASLDDGLHRITYQLASETGTSTRIQTDFFIKTPVGGYGIMSYRYWLNNNMANAKTVQLDKRTSPFVLTKLLPVDTEPIRSACFQFEVKDGRPMVYAKNDFHISFFDATGRQVDECKQYVDYGVSQAVEDITDLQATQTFARPAANTVKWFKFEAVQGDTIAVRTNQASSIQVFSPSGKEIYAASADKSVIYGGCHTWEDGTFYIAVHDVTGTKPSITLDYMHMDKYDVVAQDVHVVGNGGCSTITFQGNGFDELESVTLVSGDSIHCDSISHSSNVNTSVRFNFTGAAVGQYHAIFKFKEGVKRIENCVKIEEARPIAIEGQVAFNTQYLRSRNNDYVVKLSNTGNSTAYDVPLVVGIFTTSLSDLNYVNISGVDYYKQIKESLPMLFTETFCDSINNVMTSHGILPLLVKKNDIDYIEGYHAMHKAVLTIDLQPNSTKTVTISMNANQRAFLHVWYPNDWEVLTGNTVMESKRRASAIKSTRCTIAQVKANRCAQNEYMIQNGMGPIYDIDCSDVDPSKYCPDPSGGGGSSTPVSSLDPNDIYGYISESGSKYMSNLIQAVNYRIEFENDTTFATASAHVVEVKDTLDSKLFDLATYAPTSIKIGDKTEYLDGSPNFVKTIDMRPAINALAQVEGRYDQANGIATWRFTSIAPMTMEPTDDVMQGFLPVNYDGKSGIGEVAFDISLK